MLQAPLAAEGGEQGLPALLPKHVLILRDARKALTIPGERSVSSCTFVLVKASE
jgi:hypothetical protein